MSQIKLAIDVIKAVQDTQVNDVWVDGDLGVMHLGNRQIQLNNIYLGDTDFVLHEGEWLDTEDIDEI